MTSISRRGFLAAGAATLGLAALPRQAAAQASPLALAATTRVLDVGGRAATVLGLGRGLVLEPGQRFQVDLTNALAEPTLIHWHGQLPPNAQDGVPDMPAPMLAPGERRSYDFEPLPGTHWMHAHVPLQEIGLLAAPLIVRSAGDVAADRQEVVMFLNDFSFSTPEEVMAQITGGHAPAASHDMGHAMSGMGQVDMGKMDMPGMAMDLNDHDWDAYLANDRNLDDPEVVRVDGGTRVLLRIINAASATVFWIDTGALPGRLVAVDGHGTQPLAGSRFGIAMGQRLDIELDLPAGSGAWPVLALREGARERTGVILATAGARIPRIATLAEEAAPAFDTGLAQEGALVALEPLAARGVDRQHMVMLGGTMQPYLWTIDGATWGNHRPIEAIAGERVEMMFHNMSMMGHPIHLHGHNFQVVGINGARLSGARRDTVHVPPMSMVTVALDAGEAARWMLHCHHVPHMATGMMTEFAVS
ncbi:MAG: multicopper oxidase family protein [Tropicimonas sp.]|uniref:multicopper oxidase family protein n=1 Tax=Tropicimonas sp. TaxID=2067044 RepID=UPI003A885F6B